MQYGHFLQQCRHMASERLGRDLGKGEFAQLLKSDMGGNYNARYYVNCENGTEIPGMQLLQEAAKQAGLTLEDCLRFPVNTERGKTEVAMEVFAHALKSEDRREAALESALMLATMKRAKGKKTA